MTKQEAYEKMAQYLSEDIGVLTAGEIDGRIPTIHDVGRREGQRLQVVTEVRHAGFGLFLAQAPAGGRDISFDGGGAMYHAENDDGGCGFGWTLLRGTREQLESMGYDFDAALDAIRELEG